MNLVEQKFSKDYLAEAKYLANNEILAKAKFLG